MRTNIKTLLDKIPKSSRKLILLIAAGIVAVLLIAASEFGEKDKPSKITEAEDSQLDSVYEKELEKRLEEIVSQIDMVGRVSVMVKTASGEKNEYAVNDSVNYGVQGDRKTENEYVIVKEQNSQSGMLIKRDYPEIQGVMIVCEGGDISKVKNEVTNAVCALLGISANNVSVTKMKAGKD